MSWNQARACKLGSLLESSPQNGYSPICLEYATGKWVLGLSALKGSSLDLSEAKPAPLDEPMVDRFFLRPGDFLISRSNTLDKVGRVSVFRGGLDNCSYPDLMMRFRPLLQKVDPNYLEAYLKSELVVKYIQQHATGTSGSMKKINQTTVESIPVLLPSIQEQKEIAEISAVWNASIEKTEQLIVEKESHYTHELSRLISHEQHSHSHVTRTALSKIVTIWKGQQLNKDAMIEDGEYRVLNGGIGPSGNTTAWNCEANTITISEGGNSCGFVNFNRNKFWCGGHCYALKNLRSDVDVLYLFHYLKGRQKQLMALRVGSGLPNIQKADIESVPVLLPDTAKQAAIARYLNTLREEISILGEYVEKLNEQKRALMQKLLTGQWRVPIESNKVAA